MKILIVSQNAITADEIRGAINDFWEEKNLNPESIQQFFDVLVCGELETVRIFIEKPQEKIIAEDLRKHLTEKHPFFSGKQIRIVQEFDF